MAVDAYALTSLANLKSYLGITDATYDALLEALINRVSDKIERHCDRKFVTREFCEIVDGEGGYDLPVRNRPIIELYRVCIGGQGAFVLSNSLANISTAHAQYSILPVSEDDQHAATLDLVTVGLITTTHTIDLTAAATDRIDEVVAAINALPTGGWSARVQSGFTYYPASHLVPMERQNIGGSGTTTVEVWMSSEVDFKTNRKAGMIHMAPSVNFQNVLIAYQGGYVTIPDDLEAAALELLKIAFDTRRDMSLTGERLGDYAWTAAGGGELIGGPDFEKEMQKRLHNFCNYTFG